MSTFIAATALAAAACQPAYVPACRLAGAQPSLDLAQAPANLGPQAGGLALSPEPGGRVLARWWRPSSAPDAGESYPPGPTAEYAVLGSSGAVEQRASVMVPDAWEGGDGKNPARAFVKTGDGVAAAVSQTRARIQPDLTVQLRTFLRFTSVASGSSATSTAELADTSCLDCELAATLLRVEPANAVLFAQWPAGTAGADDRLGAAILTVDDQGQVQARLSFAAGMPLPALVPRTRPDAVALLSGSTLRLWDAALDAVGPPLELGARTGALDWDLAARELAAGTSDGQNVFLDRVAWSGAGLAVRHRASAGTGVVAVARSVDGPAVVFGDGDQLYFAHLDEKGQKRGPDVSLQPLNAGGQRTLLDSRGVLVALPDVPGGFAYFSASPAGVDRLEVRCE